MDVSAKPPASKRFLWIAVLAGLLPTLTLGGVALYLTALAFGIATTRDAGSLIRFLLVVSGFILVTLIAYWRVLWLHAYGRRPGAMLRIGSWLLMLAWFVWFAWGFFSSGGSQGWLGLGMTLAPFLCWGYALRRG
jgi:hypothetical protein